MDTSQWPQGIGVMKVPMEGSRGIIKSDKRPRPQKEQALNCPRCNSSNTKFCYYNNYSLSQPRYFCKTCRRYWTEGGSLRNVPVGGSSRKNKRSSSSKKPPPNNFSSQNPNKILSDQGHQGRQDLNLTYPPTTTNFSYPNPTPFSTIFSSGLIHNPMQEFKLSLEGFEGRYGNLQGMVQESGSSSSARLIFPFEELKQPQSGVEFEQINRGQGGYWSGMLGGGGSSW